jgi:hypothetical protein
MRWARSCTRVFEIDVAHGQNGSGTTAIIGAIDAQGVIERILALPGLPRVPRCRDSASGTASGCECREILHGQTDIFLS